MLSPLLLTLLLNGCHQRKCLDKNAYNGIYNALTCDYEGQIEELEGNITQHELKKNEEQKTYLELLDEVNQQEKEVEEYKSTIQELDTLINEIDNNLNNINTNQEVESLLHQIKSRVVKMKKKLNKERK